MKKSVIDLVIVSTALITLLLNAHFIYGLFSIVPTTVASTQTQGTPLSFVILIIAIGMIIFRRKKKK